MGILKYELCVMNYGLIRVKQKYYGTNYLKLGNIEELNLLALMRWTWQESKLVLYRQRLTLYPPKMKCEKVVHGRL